MALTYKDVADILKIIDSSSCDEVVLDVGGVRLEVRRHGAGAPPATASAPIRAAAAPSPTAPAAPPTRAEAPTAVSSVAADAGGLQIRAPMVGSFYRRPSPGEKPFVDVGQAVRKGDPLCLIEVMKLYTTIAAPADGVIDAIRVEDGALVAFDQLLIVMRAG